jgi:hypothetical protein
MMLSSLIVLRVLGGLKLYIDPHFILPIMDEWVKPLGNYTYLLLL